MGMSYEQLVAYAEGNGVRVVKHRPSPGSEIKSVWIPERRMISIATGLDPREKLCTLAHSLGHAVNGHVVTGNGVSEEDRVRADEWAAFLLINPVDYAEALRAHGDDLLAAAKKLGVTMRFVLLYRDLMARAGVSFSKA